MMTTCIGDHIAGIHRAGNEVSKLGGVGISGIIDRAKIAHEGKNDKFDKTCIVKH
jgi:hypothetical protein